MAPYDEYRSPFSYRYGSGELRRIWGERNKRLLWRATWVAMARAQSRFGLATPGQVEELDDYSTAVDLEASLEAEAETRHDLVAELRVFASQCPEGGAVLHAGATSSDIEDNVDALRVRHSLDAVCHGLAGLVRALAQAVAATAHTPMLGRTHLQAAEPTTLGYRMATWLQDLDCSLQALRALRDSVRGKGFKGAVGTSASFLEFLGGSREDLLLFEALMSEAMGLGFFPVASQVYTRRQDYDVVSALAGLGASLHKMALDLRLMQSYGEVREGTGEGQIGSSAMPFKRNPISSEKVCSLARELSVMPQVAWQTAAQSALERTLDDSACRRSMLPEAFLICDEMLSTMAGVLRDMSVEAGVMRANLDAHWPVASTERVLMAAVRAGADRQALHGKLVSILGKTDYAYAGRALLDRLCGEPMFWCLTRDQITEIMDPGGYLGVAAEAAEGLAEDVLIRLDRR